MSELAAVFRRPFAEQVAALRLRLRDQRPSGRWDQFEGPEHDRMFTVAGTVAAGAMKADLLADISAAVQKGIEDGTTLDEFRRDFRSIVEKRGWHGWTGEGTKKGEAWRTRVIYRTNMATSYAAGRMAQLVEGKFAWWVYRHGNAMEPRLHHLAWDGIALEPDDPFWATHAPPNGWGCTCYVVGARTPAGVRRVGGDPDKPLPDGWQARSPKTGAPVGIDKGWDYAPGAGVSEAILAMVGKTERLPAPIGAAFAASLPSAAVARLEEAFAAFVDEALANPPRGRHRIVGAFQPRWVSALRVRGLEPETAEIAVRDEDVLHTFRDVKTANAKAVDLAWYRALPRHLLAPDAVILDTTRADRPALLLLYGKGPGTPKLVVLVDYHVRKVGTVNVVRSGTIVDTQGIEGRLGNGYELLEGRL